MENNSGSVRVEGNIVQQMVNSSDTEVVMHVIKLHYIFLLTHSMVGDVNNIRVSVFLPQ